MLSLNLEGKVVIVTGASGALGVVVTKAFLEAGARVGPKTPKPHLRNEKREYE